MDSVPGKGTVEFGDVLVAEDAPEAIARSELGIERDWGVEEEANVGEFFAEAGEEGGEGFLVIRKVLVAETLVVVYVARFAELELAFLLLLLLLMLVLCSRSPILVLVLLPHDPPRMDSLPFATAVAQNSEFPFY